MLLLAAWGEPTSGPSPFERYEVHGETFALLFRRRSYKTVIGPLNFASFADDPNLVGRSGLVHLLPSGSSQQKPLPTHRLGGPAFDGSLEHQLLGPPFRRAIAFALAGSPPVGSGAAAAGPAVCGPTLPVANGFGGRRSRRLIAPTTTAKRIDRLGLPPLPTYDGRNDQHRQQHERYGKAPAHKVPPLDAYPHRLSVGGPVARLMPAARRDWRRRGTRRNGSDYPHAAAGGKTNAVVSGKKRSSAKGVCRRRAGWPIIGSQDVPKVIDRNSRRTMIRLAASCRWKWLWP